MFTITQKELSVQPMFTVFSFSPSYFQNVFFFSKTVYQFQFHKCNQHAAYALGIITNPCQNMVDVNQAMALELNFPEKLSSNVTATFSFVVGIFFWSCLTTVRYVFIYFFPRCEQLLCFLCALHCERTVRQHIQKYIEFNRHTVRFRVCFIFYFFHLSTVDTQYMLQCVIWIWGRLLVQ